MKSKYLVFWLTLGFLSFTHAQQLSLESEIKTLWKEKKFQQLQLLADVRLESNTNDVMALALSLDLWPVIGTNYADLVRLHNSLEAQSVNETNQMFLKWYSAYKLLHQEMVKDFGSGDPARLEEVRATIRAYGGPPPCALLAKLLGL